MNEVLGFNLTREEYNIEFGFGADTSEVTNQADLISDKWKVPKAIPSRPMLLLVGGFQGSGKTTVVDLLNQDSEFLIISPDEIRYNLFESEHPFSAEFSRLVSAIKFELLKRALNTSRSVIIDQSLTPDRVKFAKKFVGNHPTYQTKSIFLTASEDTLSERVLKRPQAKGKYKGKVGELKRSLIKYKERYGDSKDGSYDLIINVEEHNPTSAQGIIIEQLLK